MNPDTAQIHRIYIKAPAAKIWDAITLPEWTNRYGYTGYINIDLQPGGAYSVVPNEEFKAQAAEYGFPCPDPVVDGEVVEASAPNRLVLMWRMCMDEGIMNEGFSRQTWEIEELSAGYCALTLTHEFENQPLTDQLVRGDNSTPDQDGGGGHPWILADLKSLLETGTGLAGA